MKTPPLLVGAGLVFWGWQTGFIVPGVVMGVVLESSRWLKPRWEFSDTDFRRIWTFCALLLLGAAVYAFTVNDGPGGFRGLFQDPNFFSTREAGNATARTLASLFRWLPMSFFLFVGAQVYSSKGGIPLETISLILRLRWSRARKLGRPLPESRCIDVSYAYLALCLFSASAHFTESLSFFLGFCALVSWALWPQRSQRFGLAMWSATLAIALVSAYFGQRGLSQLQAYIGNLNPQWWMNFSRHRFDPAQTRTELGRIGRLQASAKIIIRLTTKTGAPPGLLRETSYRTFKHQTWYADITTNAFVRVSEETNQQTYILVHGKTNSSTVNIACYLEGGTALLPLPAGSGRLEHLMAYDLGKSPLGAVLEEGPDMVMFDACYGPSNTMDSAPDERFDLRVPELEKPALDQVLAELQAGDSLTCDQALRTLSRFFRQQFSYSIWSDPGRISRTGETPLTRFLLRTRTGHCEYFATAGVLLLRRLHIPARYAVGFDVHEGMGEKYVVRLRDAHAWCLVWDKATSRWRDVDFTPPTWVSIEGERTSKLQSLQDLWSWVTFQFSKLRWGQTHLREYFLWALIPILVFLFYQIVFRRRHRQRRQRPGSTQDVLWPGLDSEFYQLERSLAQRGVARDASEPLSDWLGRALENPALGQNRLALQELLLLHYRYRFDPRGLDSAGRQRLKSKARECLQEVLKKEDSDFLISWKTSETE